MDTIEEHEGKLPSIVEYFNRMIYPRFPHLGSFRDDFGKSPGKVICPFHEDINASLGIIPGTEVFHCFGCGVHGNVVRLHQLYIEKITGGFVSRDTAFKDLCEVFDIQVSQPKKKTRADTLIDAVRHSKGTTLSKFEKSLPKDMNTRQWSKMLLHVLEELE